MALTLSYTPGYVWTVGELVTEDKLNLAANPTINLEGTISSVSIADGSVTTPKLADGILSADAIGRAKMADTYLVASKLGPDVAGDGLQGGNGSALAVSVDGITITTVGGKLVVKSTGAGVTGSMRNLVAQNNATTPNSKVDIAADEIQLKDASGAPFLAQAVALTVDMAVSGAGGLDAPAETGNIWYYVWVIGKTDGTGVAGMFSLSSTAPTMPALYTYKALVGAVRNDAAFNFVVFYQQDREVFINDSVVFTAKTPGVLVWTALSGGDLSAFQRLVPPIAKQAWGSGGENGNNGGLAIGANASGLGGMVANKGQGSAGPVLAYTAGGSWRVPIKTSQLLYYIMGDTGGGYAMSVSGYKI